MFETNNIANAIQAVDETHRSKHIFHRLEVLFLHEQTCYINMHISVFVFIHVIIFTSYLKHALMQSKSYCLKINMQKK